MNSQFLRRTASVILAILLYIYLGYQIYNAHYEPVQTETVSYASTSDTVQVNGTAIRKERPITAQVNGILTYVISDGGKVGMGGKVAQIYANAQSAAAHQELENLDSQISELQKLSTPGDTYAANPDSIGKQINLKLTEVLSNLNAGETAKVSNVRNDLLYLMNERQIVTNRSVNFSARIAALQAKRAALAASAGAATGSITAPASGYFIRSTDGYESVFDYNNVLSLTPASLEACLKKGPVPQSETIGKICENFDWYFAFVIPGNQIVKFRLGNKVTMNFPFASSEAVPATVVAVNQPNKDSEAVVVLESNYMNSSIASMRNAAAQIQIGQYTGIRVSQKAVHFATVTKTVKDKNNKTSTVKKEVKGVYTMRGSELVFKQIFPLLSTGDYVICDADPPKDELMTASTVKLFDEVVIEGTDLYDGKVVK